MDQEGCKVCKITTGEPSIPCSTNDPEQTQSCLYFSLEKQSCMCMMQAAAAKRGLLACVQGLWLKPFA